MDVVNQLTSYFSKPAHYDVTRFTTTAPSSVLDSYYIMAHTQINNTSIKLLVSCEHCDGEMAIHGVFITLNGKRLSLNQHHPLLPPIHSALKVLGLTINGVGHIAIQPDDDFFRAVISPRIIVPYPPAIADVTELLEYAKSHYHWSYARSKQNTQAMTLRQFPVKAEPDSDNPIQPVIEDIDIIVNANITKATLHEYSFVKSQYACFTDGKQVFGAHTLMQKLCEYAHVHHKLSVTSKSLHLS